MGEAVLAIVIWMAVGFWLARHRWGAKSTVEALALGTMLPFIEAFGLLMVALSYVFGFFAWWGKRRGRNGTGHK